MPLRDELLTKYRPTMLELLRLPGMGPKTVALVWSALQVATLDELEAAARAGHLNTLPRMGEKFVTKLLKGIEDHRRNSSRFRIDIARNHAERIAALILEFSGIDRHPGRLPSPRTRDRRRPRPARHRPACEPDVVAAAVEHVATLPLIDKLMARGANKVTFTLRNNLQVDVRLLPRASYGAALQYFTGSKHHNVALRQRAIKRGLTLSEYALLRLEDNVIVAAETEEAIYNALDLDYIPPELRENCGELEAAANHTLPQLITLADLHGDVHMHTFETDGTVHHPRDGRGRPRPRPPLHRHHRPQQESRHDQRHGRRPRPRPRRPRPRRQPGDGGPHPHLHRRRGRHPRRRPAGP